MALQSRRRPYRFGSARSVRVDNFSAGGLVAKVDLETGCLSRAVGTDCVRQGIETYVIHPTSIPVLREHRRAKSDRLHTQLLMRSYLGRLRGEPKHFAMVAIPSVAGGRARRANREHETLVGERTRLVSRMKYGDVPRDLRHDRKGTNSNDAATPVRLDKMQAILAWSATFPEVV